MSTLGDAIAFLFPNASPMTDYRVENSGDARGDRIVSWNIAKLGVQPTQAEIERAKTDLDAARASETAAKQLRTTVLGSALTKLAANQDLTAAEQRAALLALIQRSNITATLNPQTQTASK